MVKEDKVSRRLVAIMFADIVGYTKLMQDNENLAKKIRDAHRKTLTHWVSQSAGETVQFYGDGSLTIFNSTIDGVNCAMKIQRDSLLSDPPVPLRVGLHTGDVVRDEEGVYGDGVNLASRVESLATTGSVMVSDKVFDDIKNQEGLPTQTMGVFEFKNVNRPVEVYAIDIEGINTPDPSELDGKVKEVQKRIAVLPFVNMSSDKDNEYFSDGITEELITALTKVDGLQVTSRTSSFAFKSQNINIPQISRQLNVNSIVEGSVRKAGDKVRIKVQLVNGADEHQVWSDTYNREVEDIFELQDEISRKIAKKLRKKLSVSESSTPIVKTLTENFKSYNEYLLGLFHYNKWTHIHTEKAVEHYEKAVEEEPEFVLPYAGLASCYSRMGIVGFWEPKVAFAKATKVARKVLKLDPDNEEAYLALSTVELFYNWNWSNGRRQVEKALQKNPNSNFGHILLGLYMMIVDRMDESFEQISKSYRVDPMSPNTIRTLADNRYFVGDYDRAIELYEQALTIDPQYTAATEFIGWTHLMAGDPDKAIEVFTSLPADETVFAVKSYTQIGYAYALKGDMEKAKEYLNKLAKLSESQKWASYNMDFAILYTGLGELDKAFDYLDKCVEERLGNLVLLHMSPIWRPLHGHDRFYELLNRIGLKPVQNN